MNKQTIFVFILIVAVGLLLFDKFGHKRNNDNNAADTVTTIIVYKPSDTVFVYKTLIPLPDSIIYHDTVIQHFDSTQINNILNDYFSIKYYNDTMSGSDVDLVLRYVISQNKIKEHTIGIKNNRESKTITYTITIPPVLRNKIFIGGGVTISPLDGIGFSVNGYLLNKNEQLYGVSYDPLNKAIGVNAAFKLRFKKR